jgi:hypothetical protein
VLGEGQPIASDSTAVPLKLALPLTISSLPVTIEPLNAMSGPWPQK